MYNGDALSFDWSTITNDITGTVVLTPKALTAAKAYTYSALSFTLKCNGVVNPATTAEANYTVSHKVSSETIATNNKVAAMALTAVSALTNVNLAATLVSKPWTDGGMCTPYTFNLKNTGTATVAAGYYVIVEFS